MADIQREIAAYERTFGRGMPRLPWPDARSARATLGRGARDQLVRLERRLRDAWVTQAPHVEAFEALAGLDPTSTLALYPCAPARGPAWVVHSVTGSVSQAPVPNQAALPRVRSYGLIRRTAYAETPVALAPLMRATAKTEVLESLLIPLAAPQQLRMVMYEQGRAALFAGFYRGARADAFGEEDHALLLAARPALRTWLRTTHALGLRPLGDGALAATLAALSVPALVVGGARVVFANTAGQSMLGATREWLGAGRPEGFATTTSIEPAGLRLEIVFPRARVIADPLASLPAALERVARRIVRGLSDKEIASELAMPLATVRTYTARVYERLGVHGRRELMLRFPPC